MDSSIIFLIKCFFFWVNLAVLRVARIGLEDVTAPKVNVVVVNALVLQRTGNVIQMFVGIVGSGNLNLILMFHYYVFIFHCHVKYIIYDLVGQ